MNKQAGFTLIELVMVIVILGILAASFAPKFLNVKDSAVEGVQAGIRGAAKSAVTINLAKNKGSWPSATDLAASVDGGTLGGTGATYGLYFDANSTADDGLGGVGDPKEFKVTLLTSATATGACTATAATTAADFICDVQ